MFARVLTAKPRFRPGALLLAAIVLLMPVAGASVADLYTARVAVADDSSSALNAGFAEALGEVLVRVTGRRDAAADAGLRAVLGDPAALVRQYRQLDGGEVLVRFDQDALRRMLDSAGEPLWGAERPATLVWLSYETQDGERELLAAGGIDGSLSGAGEDIPSPPPAVLLRQQLDDLAALRGLPLILPIVDATDLRDVRPDDLWEGRFDRILDASRRYVPDAVLVGRVRLDMSSSPIAATADAPPGSSPAPERFVPLVSPARWTLLIDGERLDWAGDLAEGPQGLADRLAERLATGRDGLSEVRLRVTGVDSLEAWGRLKAYLDSLSVIDSFLLEQVTDDSLSLTLRVRGDAERLSRSFALRRLLAPAATESGRGDAELVYRFAGSR